MNYHVLSNYELAEILTYGGFSIAILWAVFGYFAGRNASTSQPNKGFIGKILPWIVLLILLSEISLLIYRIINYPWNIEPMPSQASMIREVNEVRVTGYGEPALYPVWGWANDYQYDLLSAFSACLLWFCWTIYAFNFKSSDTSWWKKICKVIAYMILSAFIYAFRFHYYDELLVYAIFPLVVFVLLWLAKVRTPKQKVIPVVVGEATPQLNRPEETPKPIENENPSRFMPHHEIIKTEGKQNDALKPSKEESSAIDDVLESEAHVQEIKPKVEIANEERHVCLMDNQIKEKPSFADMMYCKYCGKKIEEDSTFCQYCGKRL